MKSEKATPQVPEKTGSLLAADLPASLVVFLVAVPLSLGIALASGAPLMAGLIAAIIGGIVVGLASGAPLQVSGPAAGLTVIVAGYVQQFGWGVTCLITAAAGLLQIGLGAAGVAPLALGMSPAVIHGMLAAIGILIAVSQLYVVFGGEPAGKGLKAFLHLPEAAMELSVATTLLGILVIAIMVAWPMLPWQKVKKVPSALVAVVAATGVSLVLGLNVPRVELGGSLMNSIGLPTLPGENWAPVIGAVLALCFVASAESLLSAVATDKLHTGPRANLNRELMAQGAGNTVSGLLGGLPITGVIVRSTANITSGARSRYSAVMHGVWVLVFVAALPGVINLVPLSALAGLLVYTGFKLVNKEHIRSLQHHGELPVYVVTVAAIVGTNLLMGLGIGFAVALFRLMWKLTHVDIHVAHQGSRYLVTIDGTLTFAGVPKILQRLGAIPVGSEVDIDLAIRFLDHAGYEALHSWKSTFEKMGGKVTIEGLDEMWQRSSSKPEPAARELSPVKVGA